MVLNIIFCYFHKSFNLNNMRLTKSVSYKSNSEVSQIEYAKAPLNKLTCSTAVLNIHTYCVGTAFELIQRRALQSLFAELFSHFQSSRNFQASRRLVIQIIKTRDQRYPLVKSPSFGFSRDTIHAIKISKPCLAY